LSSPDWARADALRVQCSLWRRLNDPTCNGWLVLDASGSGQESAAIAVDEAYRRYDSCGRGLEGLRAWSDPTTGLWVSAFGVPSNVDSTAGFLFTAYRQAPYAAVEACLSPDGSAVAYFTRDRELRVASLPALAVLLEQPSDLVVFPGGDVQLGLDDAQLWAHQAAGVASGSTQCAEAGFANERPALTVAIASYRLEPTEVNRAQYQRCVEAGQCPAIDESRCSGYAGEDALVDAALPLESPAGAAPRTCVTRHEAAAYCDFIGRRLPTEAEWVAAAAGRAGRIFAWGNGWDPTLARWLDGTAPHLDPAAVHRWGATPEGLYDMSGNAFEWVSDSACNYDDWPAGASQCDSAGDVGVLHGGGFLSDSSELRTSFRRFASADARIDTHGFRCAAEPAAPDSWCGRIPLVAGLPFQSMLALERQCLVDGQGAWGIVNASTIHEGSHAYGHLSVIRIGRESEVTLSRALRLDQAPQSFEYLVEATTRDWTGEGTSALVLVIARRTAARTQQRLEAFALSPEGDIVGWPRALPQGTAGILREEDVDGNGSAELVLATSPVAFDGCSEEAAAAPTQWSAELVASVDEGGAGLTISPALTRTHWLRICAAHETSEWARDLSAPATLALMQDIVCDRVGGGDGRDILDEVALRCAAAPAMHTCAAWFACDNIRALGQAATLPLPF
jgi:formylglycine-generating enzyme required for sulfatase activity